jgi:hypothetical protein
MKPRMSQREIIKILNDLELEPEKVRQKLEPERCRTCQSLLVPNVQGGGLTFLCLECDSSTTPSR